MPFPISPLFPFSSSSHSDFSYISTKNEEEEPIEDLTNGILGDNTLVPVSSADYYDKPVHEMDSGLFDLIRRAHAMCKVAGSTNIVDEGSSNIKCRALAVLSGKSVSKDTRQCQTSGEDCPSPRDRLAAIKKQRTGQIDDEIDEIQTLAKNDSGLDDKRLEEIVGRFCNRITNQFSRESA
jgi:hypothetical protein